MTEEEWNDLTKDQKLAYIKMLEEYWSNLEEEEEEVNDKKFIDKK